MFIDQSDTYSLNSVTKTMSAREIRRRHVIVRREWEWGISPLYHKRIWIGLLRKKRKCVWCETGNHTQFGTRNWNKIVKLLSKLRRKTASVQHNGLSQRMSVRRANGSRIINEHKDKHGANLTTFKWHDTTDTTGKIMYDKETSS